MAGGSMAAWMKAWEGDLTPSPAARRSAAREAARDAAVEAREISARSRAARYYGREATARLPEPLPEAERASVETIPVLQVVARRRPRWGVVLATLVVAVILVGGSVVVPVMLNAATTEIEAAVGKAEAMQEGLATSTSAIAAQISNLSAPERVAEQAAQLGLVPAADVNYVAAGPGVEDTEGDTEVAGR